MGRFAKSPTLVAASLAMLAFGLSACDFLGIEKSPPDEYAVSVGPSLAIPPDVELRPPGEAGEAPAGVSAEALLLGTQTPSASSAALFEKAESGEVSAGELALLQKAGAMRADPRIRQVIAEEGGGYAVENSLFIEDLLFWQGEAGLPEGVLVDPEAEARRLDENAALGRPATEGETPVVEPLYLREAY